MTAIIGIILIMFGGLASGAFYLPLKYVKNWKWETGWIMQGIAAWIVGPWLMAIITLPHLGSIISESPASNIYWPIIFGFGWGIGGLTWGLSIRYLGIGLGNALPLGLTSALSTIIPKIADGTFMNLFDSASGRLTLLSIVVSLAGIGVCGWAASLKDKDISKGESKGSDFDLKKGLMVALVAGVMSACFAFGEAAGKDMAAIAEKYNPGTIWRYNAVYAILLIGGFVFNMVYCLILSFKNKSFSDYSDKKSPLRNNYIFALMAGFIWFAQFVFKGIGTTQVPSDISFITWSILFSCVIVFSNIIGMITGEWKGVSRRTVSVLMLGLVTLIISVVMVGFAAKIA